MPDLQHPLLSERTHPSRQPKLFEKPSLHHLTAKRLSAICLKKSCDYQENNYRITHSRKSYDKFFVTKLGPNSLIANQIQTGTPILAANIHRQTTMFLKRRVKTKPLQNRITCSSPRTFRARNAAYEKETNLQNCETLQTLEETFFDKNTFLDKNTILEDQTIIRTNTLLKHVSFAKIQKR